MLKRFEGYLLGNFFASFTLILLILFISFSIVQTGEIMKNAATGLKLTSIISLIPLTFPIFFFYFSFPTTLLTIFTITVRMQKKNELLILRSSGVSIKPIPKTISIFITIVTLLNFYNISFLLPGAKYKLTRDTLHLLKNSTVSLLQREGFTILEKKIAILVKRRGNKSNILLFSEKNSMPVIISASDLSYKHGEIVFDNGEIIPFKANETDTMLKFKKGKIPPSFLLPVKSKYEITSGEIKLFKLIHEFIEHPSDSDISVELNRRLIFALAPLLVGWIGLLPFGLKRGEDYWGYLVPIGISFLLFYILTSIGRNLLYQNRGIGSFIMWSSLLIIALINFLSEDYIMRKQ